MTIYNKKHKSFFRLFLFRGILVVVALVAAITVADRRTPNEVSPVEKVSEEANEHAYDFENDPIGTIFYGKITPLVQNILNRYVATREYSSADFPMDLNEHARFKEELVSSLFQAMNQDGYSWKKNADYSKNFKEEKLGEITLDEKQVVLKLFKLTITQTGDEVPVALCIPMNHGVSKSDLPAVIAFSGHTISSGIRDLLIDESSYQQAAGLKLCQAGFVVLAVEKLDSGYTTISFQVKGEKSQVEREPGGGGDDELEVATTLYGIDDYPIFARQLMANLSALMFLLQQNGVDPERIGATGVSFGGWQAAHMALLRPDRIKSISSFGGMWSYLEDHIDRDDISSFWGIPDYSQMLPGGFLLGDQNRFLFAVAPVKMQIGYGLEDDPYIHYKDYFYPKIKNQYEIYGAEEDLVEITHDGGHVFPVELMISYFEDIL